MGIERIGEPNPAFKTEGLIGQRTHRANVNHVSGEIIIDRLFYIGLFQNGRPGLICHAHAYP